MKILTIILLLLGTLAVSAQSKYGIELRTSRNITFNTGELEGDYLYVIDGDDNLATTSYSIGLYYTISSKHILKVHIGKHQNGRILDYYSCGDFGGCSSNNVKNHIFNYIQLSPSYEYRFYYKKVILPVELVVNINRELSYSFVSINDFNFDARLSVGVQYPAYERLLLGLKVVFLSNLKGYQNSKIEMGTYSPKLLGLEFSAMYGF